MKTAIASLSLIVLSAMQAHAGQETYGALAEVSSYRCATPKDSQGVVLGENPTFTLEVDGDSVSVIEESMSEGHMTQPEVIQMTKVAQQVEGAEYRGGNLSLIFTSAMGQQFVVLSAQVAGDTYTANCNR